MSKLPIVEVLPELKKVLHSGVNAVLIAAPGAGKTTQVPLALLEEPWLQGRRILMLEPRRLAARSAATYMAMLLGEQVGETVGYRVRLDTRVSARTRIEVITEGVLTRMLQADPALEEVGAVIFDEYHERSLQADLGLAFCLQSQAVLREDLRILVMSATLEAEPVAKLLKDAPVIISEGRSFPVNTHFLDRRIKGPLEPVVAQKIGEALESCQGDILVFLPGAGEIRRVEARLREQEWGKNIRIAPLYGNLPQKEQDEAIAPSRRGERKVVLATSIAETSLTVEGVEVVIDSGLIRVPRFYPRTGMTRLETIQVTRSSADQRRGRAGRLGPGTCYRLWTEEEDRQLAFSANPEILQSDLSQLALELAAWGVYDPAELAWMNPPPQAALSKARELLMHLGALEEDGRLTAHGRSLAESGLHPRLAHMILKAIPVGLGGLACEVAGLLNERDLLRGVSDADFRLRLEALHEARRALRVGKGEPGDLTMAKRILGEVDTWKRYFGIHEGGEQSAEACGVLLAFAYPDRIAQQRGAGSYLLRNGRGAVLLQAQKLSNSPFLAAAELDDQGTDSRILLASPVSLDDLRLYFGDEIQKESLVYWDRGVQAVRARSRERLGALILKEIPLVHPDPEECLSAILEGIGKEGLNLLPWTKNARQLQDRLMFMHQHVPGWPDLSDAALLATLRDWLGPHLYGMKNANDLKDLSLVSLLEGMFPWDQRRELDECAPSHLTVPSGSKIPVDYSDPTSPVLAVRLQEMFGQEETPRIARGKVPLTLHLLSPARRPVQITRDLGSFWQTTYFEIKKDLKGRYPKHYWPDDPTKAVATNRTRPG
ncbi:ATP-dependent helicase HrpB [Ammoniphilus sp. YIM 78166]|uniref:ATP-dependent helicase HrpB n=1 Tax=Ammoniphilus sp. YIM 78166 TaxID=1644106 RepID=UPI001070398A|nr:ATP-dependent helicase HrpB [Ammoniphilus sp. YIM 78166]